MTLDNHALVSKFLPFWNVEDMKKRGCDLKKKKWIKKIRNETIQNKWYSLNLAISDFYFNIYTTKNTYILFSIWKENNRKWIFRSLTIRTSGFMTKIMFQISFFFFPLFILWLKKKKIENTNTTFVCKKTWMKYQKQKTTR